MIQPYAINSALTVPRWQRRENKGLWDVSRKECDTPIVGNELKRIGKSKTADDAEDRP